jgi:preprotein translocase subunit SecA
MASFLTRLQQLLHRIRSGAIEFDTNPYQRQLRKINAFESHFRDCRDDQLQAAAQSLSDRAAAKVPRPRLLAEAFALVREVAERVLGMRPYDEQMLAALVLDQGKVAEMQTGEGKTLAAVAPAFLSSLSGRGVHVLTFNDYLARRDAQWMGPVYQFLGVTVGHVQQGMTIAERQEAYVSQVTYVTAKEAGFDFLRDQICMDPTLLVQRSLSYAIVDEADSILIDEARVPLVIAGETDELDVNIEGLPRLVQQLDAEVDYAIDRSWRNVNFTANGLDRIEEMLGCGDLHDDRNLELLTRLNLALQAEVQLHRDIDYLVRDGKIELIDEFTGRVAENRRWPYGLQAAIEAKEGLRIQADGMILGSITLQHLLEQYDRLAGMTGTAVEAADELHEFYGLKVVSVPTHKPCARCEDPDTVFDSKQTKQLALVAKIAHVHGTGRPVLVGTASVRESEELAATLRDAGVTCNVLNAKNDELEAELVADAGAVGAVTISTNMAGRGTDIRLGGHDERDRESVLTAGGLYVIGCNRHESRRIDNQLQGRSARQGDPGGASFFVSLEDDLLVRYGVGRLEELRKLGNHSGLLSEDPQITHRIAHSQRVIEGETFEIRRTLRRYSSVVERQRKELFARRQAILTDKLIPTLLRERAADRYRRLVAKFGEQQIRIGEKQITLFHINQCWADHLAHVAEIREQIHLFSMGGYNPLDEFHRRINQSMTETLGRIDDAIVATFHRVEFTEDGLDLPKYGLTGPSSTWTYMINDTPMGDVLDRITQGLKRRLTGRRGAN